MKILVWLAIAAAALLALWLIFFRNGGRQPTACDKITDPNARKACELGLGALGSVAAAVNDYTRTKCVKNGVEVGAGECYSDAVKACYGVGTGNMACRILINGLPAELRTMATAQADRLRAAYSISGPLGLKIPRPIGSAGGPTAGQFENPNTTSIGGKRPA